MVANIFHLLYHHHHLVHQGAILDAHLEDGIEIHIIPRCLDIKIVLAVT